MKYLKSNIRQNKEKHIFYFQLLRNSYVYRMALKLSLKRKTGLCRLCRLNKKIKSFVQSEVASFPFSKVALRQNQVQSSKKQLK